MNFNPINQQYPSMNGLNQWNVPQGNAYPTHGLTNYGPTTTQYDFSNLCARIELLQRQVQSLTEYLMVRGFGNTLPMTQNHPSFYGTGFSQQFTKIRENETSLYWDLYLPELSIGDVEVEVIGNKVLCRTRVPFRFERTELHRGFECIQLGDGRCEFAWYVPVAFITKNIEATWRDGYLTIAIARADLSSKQTIRINQTSARQEKTA